MLKNPADSENERVRRIERWRGYLATLPDDRFFDIMRIYLGGVRTPFNKQRLIERLSAFFRREQNRANIAALLSDFDRKVITVISIVPAAGKNTVVEFFREEYSLSEIYAELSNLAERLLIFPDRNPDGKKPSFALNPLLDDVLEPFIDARLLFPPAVRGEPCGNAAAHGGNAPGAEFREDAQSVAADSARPSEYAALRRDAAVFENARPALSPLLIAAFVSYIEENPELCKNDGSIKKNHLARLSDRFPGKTEVLRLLLNAFFSLRLVKYGEKGVSADEKRLRLFAELREDWQYAYLCAAVCGNLGRERLRVQTQLLLDVAATIPAEGFTRSSILRAALVLGRISDARPAAAAPENRFHRILRERLSGASGVFSARDVYGAAAAYSAGSGASGGGSAVRASGSSGAANTQGAEFCGAERRDAADALSANECGADSAGAGAPDRANCAVRAASAEKAAGRADPAGIADGAAGRSSGGLSGSSAGTVTEQMIDAAAAFGLFTICGKTAGGDAVFTAAPVLTGRAENPQSDGEAVRNNALRISAVANVTLLPVLALRELLPLMPFLSLVRCSTAAEFEINGASAARAFDRGLTPPQICALLGAYTEYPVPKNLEISLEDWYSAYSSATLYKGYVLKVGEKNRRLAEKNPKLAPFIQEKLAPGIYLLNIPAESSADEFIAKCGFDFIGSVKAAACDEDAAPFQPLRAGIGLFDRTRTVPAPERSGGSAEGVPNAVAVPASGGASSDAAADSGKAEALLSHLHSALDRTELSRPQKDCLSERIDRRVIVSEEQLCADTVRLEILEAGGLDYTAKLRLAENAVSAGDMIEITVQTDGGARATVLGRPLLIIRQQGDAMIKLETDPGRKIRFYSVSKAAGIKVIRTSVFLGE